MGALKNYYHELINSAEFDPKGPVADQDYEEFINAQQAEAIKAQDKEVHQDEFNCERNGRR